MKPLRQAIPDELLAELAPYFTSPRAGAVFRNPWQHPPLPSLSAVVRWKTQGNEVRPRDYRVEPVPVVTDALAEFDARRGAATRVFWIGHASFLLELDGVRFVVDPIFGRAGGFVPRVTPAAARPEQLTSIAAVLVTHGHHDHLDPAALRELAIVNGGRALFVVPRGLGAVLPRQCRPFVELDWWEYVELQGVRVVLVPAQHWHRRGMFDLNKSLWGGIVLAGTHRVYHSGDTGYFDGFRAIGSVFGGIDAACLPLGAYEPRWFMRSQHMNPEESLTAAVELDATHFVGMHWGAYDLSDEPLAAGPRLARERALAQGLSTERVHVVLPGGSVSLQGARGHTRAETLHPYKPGEPS